MAVAPTHLGFGLYGWEGNDPTRFGKNGLRLGIRLGFLHALLASKMLRTLRSVDGRSACFGHRRALSLNRRRCSIIATSFPVENGSATLRAAPRRESVRKRRTLQRPTPDPLAVGHDEAAVDGPECARVAWSAQVVERAPSAADPEVALLVVDPTYCVRTAT